MKPLKSALFFAGILILVQGFYFLMPQQGMDLFSLHLRNPLPEAKWQKRLAEHPALPDTVATHTVYADTLKRDTVAVRAPANRLSFTDSLKRKTPRLAMSDTARTALYRLFGMLDSVRTGKNHLHILYYGDSQIEGDRITSVVRDSLQNRFGGGGPGLFLPVMTVPFTATLRIEPSGSWSRVSVFRKQTGKTHFPVGVFGEISVLTPPKDSAKTGYCRVISQLFASDKAATFNHAGIWYYPLGGKVRVSVLAGGEKIGEKTDNGVKQLVYQQFTLGKRYKKLDIEFGAGKVLGVEGLLLEDSVGVGVDNIPLRGRPLMPFTKCDHYILAKMFKQLNVKMIILQFGLNVAVGNEKDVGYYRKTFNRQLHYLRKNFPDVFVVVVGVTDMAGHDGEIDKRLQEIRRVQKKGAMAAGYAFWDAYEAMGGKKSIIRWALQHPSLARPDYAHLSRKGAELLATLFISSLMKDYKEYQNGK